MRKEEEEKEEGAGNDVGGKEKEEEEKESPKSHFPFCREEGGRGGDQSHTRQFQNLLDHKSAKCRKRKEQKGTFFHIWWFPPTETDRREAEQRVVDCKKTRLKNMGKK